MKKLLLALLLVSIFSAPSYAKNFASQGKCINVWYDTHTHYYLMEVTRKTDGFIVELQKAKKENTHRTKLFTKLLLNKKIKFVYDDMNDNIPDNDQVVSFKVLK